MTSETRSGETVSDDIEIALMKLARRGAFLAKAALSPSSAPGDVVEIYCQRHGVVSVIGGMSVAICRGLIESPLVEEEGGRYVLSRSGRLQARRRRAERLAEGAKTTAAGSASARGGSKAGEELQQPGFNPDESPLSKLRNRIDRDGEALISREQYEAGERLRFDLWRAGLTPRVTQQWHGIPQSGRSQRSASGIGIDVPDGTVAARERAIRALAAVGSEHIDLLIDVCGHLKGLEEIERTASLPQRSARHFLQHALTALARHYGLLQTENAESMVRARLQHWGSPKYRLPARLPEDGN